MELTVNRLKDDGTTTIGTIAINGKFACFSVEDANHDVKVAGETCIPAGTYEIKLRNEGGMTKRYSAKYPFHEGMLWLQDVPGFEWVYIHTGNKASHSEGCLLVNDSCDSSTSAMSGGKSMVAYTRLYNKVIAAMNAGEQITIRIE